jgi:predicted P-loop ATPase
MVLAPSIHPTGGQYKWKTPILDIKDLPVVDFGKIEGVIEKERIYIENFKLEERIMVDLPQEIQNKILDYNGIDDGNGVLLSVCNNLVALGWTNNQILTLLTNRQFALGEVAYRHTKSESRKIAAQWILNYTIPKARENSDAQLHFETEVETIELNEIETQKQIIELVTPRNWKDRIERNGTKGQNPGSPRPTLKNLILIFENEVAPDVFKRDEFALRDFYGHSTPWGGKKNAMITDDDAINIKVWLGARYRFEPKKELIYEAISHLCGKNCFDPVKDELENLPEWDGVIRLDNWLKNYFEAEGDPEYLGQVFRKWMVAMVMRVYEPGSKFDWMPIFEGKQGIGKSSIGRLLVGQKYFLDWLPDLSDKDSALSLQGARVVEFGELANLRKQDVESVKAFVTRTVDKVRPPYGKRWIECPRRCVFFGTTNSDTYLRDDSGNRRFKPISVGQLDFEALERDREQLFCEALFIYKNEFETELTLDIEGNAKVYEAQIQSDKMVEDESIFMAETFSQFMNSELKKPQDERHFFFEKFKITDLFNENVGPFRGYRSDMRHLQFAAKALKSLGGEKWKSDGANYWRVKITPIGVPYKSTHTLHQNEKNDLEITT